MQIFHDGYSHYGIIFAGYFMEAKTSPMSDFM